MDNATHNTGSTSTKAVWLKRAGLLTFCFFLVKGLIWLGVGAAAVIGSLSIMD